MNNAYSRKKDPERVRRALLDCAARIATKQGLAALTIQAVSDAAGVTKGGLFHHFPSRQALIEGLFADLTVQLDAAIDAYIANDPNPRGSFTRAYLQVALSYGHISDEDPWIAFSLSMISELQMKSLWSEWLEGRLRRHSDTDSGLMFEIVRLAADGIWLALALGYEQTLHPNHEELRERLISLMGVVSSER